MEVGLDEEQNKWKKKKKKKKIPHFLFLAAHHTATQNFSKFIHKINHTMFYILEANLLPLKSSEWW